MQATGLQALCRCLPFNECLTDLNIAQNRFYDDGVLILFRLLRPNRHLLRMDISNNNLTHYASEAMEAALAENHTIKHLVLSDNAFFPQNVQDMECQLVINRLLVELDETQAQAERTASVTNPHRPGGTASTIASQSQSEENNYSSTTQPSVATPTNLTTSPLMIDIRKHNKKFRSALRLKLHHLNETTLRALRDGNESIKADLAYMEKLLELVPYSRKEILTQSLEYVSERRQNNQSLDAKAQAIQNFLLHSKGLAATASSARRGTSVAVVEPGEGVTTASSARRGTSVTFVEPRGGFSSRRGTKDVVHVGVATEISIDSQS